MNFHVLSWLMFFLAPGGCPIYSINVSTFEVSTSDFQNELTLHTMLSSEMRQYRDCLYGPVVSPKRSVWEVEMSQEMPKPTRDAASGPFLGTNLFENQRKRCFSFEEMALMSARRTFEQLVPKSHLKSNKMLGNDDVQMLIRFVNTVNHKVDEMSDKDTRRLLQRAFYDALGGYLRYYMVPVAQVSYYAGRLKLKTTQCLGKIKRKCYVELNTNGNAWRTPAKDIMCQLKGMKIKPIELDATKFEDGAVSCAELDQGTNAKETDQGQMIVPLPQLEPVDSDGYLSNIFLPFRQRRIYNLRSPCSAGVLVRFFKTVTVCHRFLEKSQANYNNKLLMWIRESVHSHYLDELFYPGLGGILQIQETLLNLKQQGYNHSEEQHEDSTESEKNVFVAESRKLHRSTDHAIPEDPEEQHKDEPPTSQEGEETSEQQDAQECRECDSDDTWIWCIAAFLVLLLIVILIIIAFCMRRAKKRKEKTPFVTIDVEAPPSSKPKSSKKVKERPKAGDIRHPYYTDPEYNDSSSSLNCQFNKKCLPVKCGSPRKDANSYNLITEGSTSLRPLVPSASPRFHLDISSETEGRESNRKQAQRSSKEAKRKGRKVGGSDRRNKEAKSSIDRKSLLPKEKRKTNRGKTVETDESSYEHRHYRKNQDEKETAIPTRLKGGTATSPKSLKDSPSWETTFDDN